MVPKMYKLLLLLAIIVFCGCKTEKKSINADGEPNSPHGNLSLESQLMLGNRLFSEKTCTTCHAVSSTKVGPSVKEIMRVYKEKNGDIVAFLKGESNPIVDTTASQVAIMRANIEGFLKDVTDDELRIIANYMLHVDEMSLD